MTVHAITVTRHAGFGAAHRLARAWSALHTIDPRAGPWTHPSLLIAFHRMFRPGGQPLILAAHDSGGTLRGVLPMSLSSRRIGPILARRLQPLGAWHSCYPDAVVHPDSAATTLKALATALGAVGWEEFHMNRVASDAWLIDSEFGFLDRASWMQREAGGLAPYISLPPERPLLAGADGREVRRSLRRLEERGRVRVGWEMEGDALRATAAEFVALHGLLKAHQQQTRTFTFGTAEQDFPDWLATEAAAHRASLFGIWLDGQLLGACVILRGKGRSCCYRSAWDLNAAKYGVGVLLITEAMAACRAAGDAIFDLGPGEEPYKDKWHPVVRPLTTLHCTRDTWRKQAAHAWLRVRGLS